VRHGGSRNTGDTGPAGMHSLGPGAVAQEFQPTGGYGKRDPLGLGHLGNRQAGKLADH